MAHLPVQRGMDRLRFPPQTPPIAGEPQGHSLGREINLEAGDLGEAVIDLSHAYAVQHYGQRRTGKPIRVVAGFVGRPFVLDFESVAHYRFQCSSIRSWNGSFLGTG